MRRGLLPNPKKRSLILTDYPRLICIKDAPTKVTLKSEVFLGAALKGGVTKPGAVAFVRAEKEGERGLVIKTVSWLRRCSEEARPLISPSAEHSRNRLSSTRRQQVPRVDGSRSYGKLTRVGCARRLAGEARVRRAGDGHLYFGFLFGVLGFFIQGVASDISMALCTTAARFTSLSGELQRELGESSSGPRGFCTSWRRGTSTRLRRCGHEFAWFCVVGRSPPSLLVLWWSRTRSAFSSVEPFPPLSSDAHSPALRAASSSRKSPGAETTTSLGSPPPLG